MSSEVGLCNKNSRSKLGTRLIVIREMGSLATSILEMMYDPRFSGTHPSPNEMQLPKSCVSFGEECRLWFNVANLFQMNWFLIQQETNSINEDILRDNLVDEGQIITLCIYIGKGIEQSRVIEEYQSTKRSKVKTRCHQFHFVHSKRYWRRKMTFSW